MSDSLCISKEEKSSVDGAYEVTYRNSLDQSYGVGQLIFKNGMVKGSDAAYDWEGTCATEGTHIYGELQVKPNRPIINIFHNTDALKINFSGEILEDKISAVGVDLNNPEQQLVAELRRIKV